MESISIQKSFAESETFHDQKTQIYFVRTADAPFRVKTRFLKFILIVSAGLANWRVAGREHAI